MKILRVIIVPLMLLAWTSSPDRASAASVTPVWLFTGSPDGSGPVAGLILANDGFFYGTASAGGANNFGTVFRVSSTGGLTNLYLFTGHADGAISEAPLIQAFDDNFYGTTFAGGTNSAGVVFKITSAGTLSTLWQFTSASDGSQPLAGLVQGSDSNFYGTTLSGGAHGAGTVFQITPAAVFTNLYSFTGGTDGGSPEAGLIQGSDGFFYGTTSGGGSGDNGTIFKISSAGTLTTLYRFSGGSDGSEPQAQLVQVNATNFLGTTFSSSSGNGVLFRLNIGVTLTNVTSLHGFSGGVDGANPAANLILANDGFYYGTTSAGGSGDNGTIFRTSATGGFTNLYVFTGLADGGESDASLVQGSDNNFYGTCSAGGTADNGNVFKFVLSSASSNTLTQIKAIQIVGSNIIITIPSLSTETYQLQTSALMNPTNWSNVAGAVVAGTGSPVTLTNVGGALLTPQHFYRVDISP
jgi:uncharacterized repeat protein (TIGR03803 family)